jgi:hypothetical protein
MIRILGTKSLEGRHFFRKIIASIAIFFFLTSILAVHSSAFSSPMNLSSDSNVVQYPNVQSIGSFVYVAWSESSHGIFFKASSTSGSGFSSSLKIGSSGSAPLISATGSDVYVVWSQGSNVEFVSSTNKGVSFTAQKTLHAGITPAIASDGSTVAVAYASSTASYVETSSNGGAAWGTPFKYASGPEPEVVVSGTNIYAVADSSSRMFVPFAVSHNSGATWIVKNMGHSGSEAFVATAGSNVYAVWETKGTSSTVWFLSSTDNGNTVSTKEISSALPDSWNPAIAAMGSSVWVGIQEHPGGSKAQIWILTSTNNGASFSTPVLTSTSGLDDSYPFQVTTTDGVNVFMMWSEHTSTTTWSTMVASSSNGGSSWSTTNVSNNPSGTQAGNNNDLATASIASQGAHAFAAWQYLSGTTTQIYFIAS